MDELQNKTKTEDRNHNRPSDYTLGVRPQDQQPKQNHLQIDDEEIDFQTGDAVIMFFFLKNQNEIAW